MPFGFLTTLLGNWEEWKVKRIQKYLDRDILKTGPVWPSQPSLVKDAYWAEG